MAKIIKADRLFGDQIVWVQEGPRIGPLPCIHNVEAFPVMRFDWGNQSNGAAHLALAILREFTDRETATALYGDYLVEVIASTHQDAWQKTEEEIKEWINTHRQQKLALS